ncbi:MAG TPA: amino acid adenylation domain-containing protein, partial [Pyrinomonadaceae bacterium]|nr:amino acid adenylation domain-containing protein [Pyrinomonadaceae bacterium]
MREACLGAYAHQDVPFERLVEEVSPRRSLTHTPLFQVMFALQNESAIELEAPGLKLSSFGVKNEAAKFDLTLTLTASANGLAAEFSYQSELFDAGRIGRMWRHYVRVLEELTARPEQRLSEVEILTPGERLQQLLEWNETAREYPSELIHETFAAQAARMPRAVALVAGEQSVTYEELNALAELSATCLRQQGVRRGALVGVLMERSVEMVVALLGVLKAGAAYVPLDPSYPRERLAYMLKDSGACLLVTQRRLLDAGVLDAGATALPPVICLDGNWDELRAQVSTVSETPTLNDRPCGDDLAYVIYTSGSTGQPKGAAITHRGIRNHMCWMQENFPLDATHCVLQKTPFGFDASVWEFYAPLMSGARLVLARPGGHQDPSYLIETIDRHQVTTLQLVPSALRLLLEENALAQCTSLQRVFCGGEELTPDLQQRFYRLLPTAKLYNLYGPTEATIDATSHPCDATQQKVPIGRPVANTQIYILDRHLRPVPVGVPGELYIAGDGLARGYLNRPELTAERFLPDPFGAAGGRLYRTGDRARFLSDGSIEYLGRVDYQVKVRGFRIELGEVEAALAAHPQVNEAVVVAREDEAGDKQLVAYLIADQATAVFVESRELRAFLKEQLPDYMIPVHYVWLESFPLTPNGKVDRKALPAPDKTESASFGGYIAPQTPVQELLAGIWEGVLKVERVGITDNFFELGGHSLLAMLLASRVHEAFGVEVPLRTLFEEPTVTALATAVETALRVDVEQGTQTESAPPPLVRFEQPPGEEQTEQRELPLSYAQQRLWFIDQLEPESAAYNIPAAVRLTGEVDVAALERAIGEVVRRHEVLRTSFAMRAGEPVQVIHAAPAMTLPLTDISHLVREEREREAGRLAAEEAARPFNLGVWPLVRAELLKMGEDEHVLLLTMHHIVSDGWSFSVLIKEVSTLYAAYVKGEESPLAELPVQYADYARWQREWLTGEVLDRQVAYWREQLRGVPETLELPTDRVRAGESSHRGGTVRVQLEAGLTRRLKETSRREGVTLYMLLLAAFQTLLSKYSGQEEVVVGSPIAGRTRREVEGLIGFFVNTLALR